MTEKNGCGCGSGLLKYFKPPYTQFFKIEYNVNDLAYDDGGCETDRRLDELSQFKVEKQQQEKRICMMIWNPF